ncbi:MAG: hypothetical protein Q9191_003191 [Dirinaria sp. TL-2023a]
MVVTKWSFFALNVFASFSCNALGFQAAGGFLTLSQPSLTLNSSTLPLQSTETNKPIPQNSSVFDVSLPNALSIEHNIRNKLAAIANDPDDKISHSYLATLSLLRPEHDGQFTTSASSLREIWILTIPREPGPLREDHEVITFINTGLPWEQWREPGYMMFPTDLVTQYNEMQWEEIQALLPLEEADRLVKTAGYTQPDFYVSIKRVTGKRFGWCFGFSGIGISVLIELLTKRLYELSECPDAQYGSL